MHTIVLRFTNFPYIVLRKQEFSQSLRDWYQVRDQRRWQSFTTTVDVQVDSMKKIGDFSGWYCILPLSVHTFFKEWHVNSVAWPANSLDLNPIEDWEKKIDEKAPSCRTAGTWLMKKIVSHLGRPEFKQLIVLFKYIVWLHIFSSTW